MEQLALNIAEIIKDYSAENGQKIDSNHVLKWASQFKNEDQEFLLSELLHILPKSYISKDTVIKEFNEIFEYLRKFNKYESITEFFSHTEFLSCQEAHKSQTKLLEFLNEIAKEHYGIELDKCGDKGVKHWIYLDDVLASGGTFRREIIEKIDAYGHKKFKSDGITVIPIFFFLHIWGMKVINYGLKVDFGMSFNFHRVHEIENDPRINRTYNPNPIFNNAYPSIDLENDKWNEYLDSINGNKHREYAYRQSGKPEIEEFYSSAENRKRYEKIILDKGLEILSKVENISPPIRPLGLTYPNYLTFGTGSHAFTWRNVSNTCPIVYWWENHEWYPLFPVNNRGNH